MALASGSMAAPRRAASASRVVPLLLIAGAALSALTMLKGIQPNDEGLMLQAAARIADGQLPYRDFWWFYPPGQPFLLALVWKLLGPSLLGWRVIRVAADATVAVLAYALARRGAGERLALTAWLAAALAMAYPSGPQPFPLALALALGALASFERRPLLAGVLAGLCALWRLEFAAYLALGVLAGLAATPAPRGLRAARFAGAGALTALAGLAPLALAAGPGRTWDLLVRHPIDFARYQQPPFPLHYAGRLNLSSPWGFLGDSAESLLLFYLPLALVIGLAGSLLALVLRPDREALALRLATAVLAVGMALYLWLRPDVSHTAPLCVLVAVLAAWALAPSLPRRRRDPTLAPVPAAASISLARMAASGPAAQRGAGELRARAPLALGAGVLAALALGYALLEGADRRWLALRQATVPLRLAVADGVRVRAAERDQLERAVALVTARVPPGRPIYVATRRSDLVTSADPLFYILAARPNPTRYDIEAPGVVTSAPVQRELVAALRRARPAVVVRFTAPGTAAPERSGAGRSSGVMILDRYLSARYRVAARLRDYVLLERR